MAIDSAKAQELGRRSGRARRRLTLEDVEAQLPAMQTPEQVKQRLEVLTNWAAAGLVTAGAAGAAVRACEIWYRLNDLEMDRKHLAALEQQVRRLETELAETRRTADVA